MATSSRRHIPSIRSVAALALVVGMTGAVFVIDLIVAQGTAVWLLYLVPLVVASRIYKGLYTQAFAALLIVLLFFGYVAKRDEAASRSALVNRTVAVAVFLISASLLSARREAEERLETLNEELEERVQERTGQLETTNSELTGKISELQISQEEIRKRDAQLLEAQQIAHLGSWEWELGTGRLTMSEELEKMFGLGQNGNSITFEEYIARVHPGDRRFFRQIVEGALRDRAPFSLDHRIVLPDGAVRTLHGEGSVVADAAGNPVRMAGTGQDITERKRIEDALARSRDYYIKLLDDFPNLIWRARPDGTRDYFNKAWLRFTGRSFAQEVGNSWAEGVHPDDRTRCATLFHDALERRESFVLDYRLHHHDGTYHWIIDHGMPIDGLDGEFAGYLGSCFDNEEQRRARDLVEEQARALQRTNADLEQFAYVASHDLQEPLRMVAGFLQLVNRRYGETLDENGRQFVGYAVDGAVRMQEMITDLLAYARLGRSERPYQLLESSAALDRALAHLAPTIQETGATINCRPLPPVLGDEGQLVQVFQNLVANAIKFRSAEPPVISISAREGTDEWIFSIQDNGIGIDPSKRDRIFGLFQRLHTRESYPGTGLGLAICKRIVESHGGRIGVDAAPGHGSIFWFTMPMVHQYQGQET
ncbi:MAG TPA: ATP-binding protein [Bacteroidota bacterium]